MQHHSAMLRLSDEAHFLKSTNDFGVLERKLVNTANKPVTA